MGQGLQFLVGEGPHLSPTLLEVGLDSFTPAFERFEPVYETVRRTRSMIGTEVTMLGFAGSPWTVATYMIAGEGSKDQGPARLLAYRDPAHLQAIIDAIVDVSVTYLRGQIDAGAEAVQLFDSWAGSLAPDQFEKGAGAKLPAYARETGVDAVGLDETLDPAWAHASLPEGMPVQGNLDPLLVEAGGPALPERVKTIIRAFEDRPHVFNLGHGIGQHTPISHVEDLLAALRG
jgi:uroporphyrinogen decarboxylase